MRRLAISFTALAFLTIAACGVLLSSETEATCKNVRTVAEAFEAGTVGWGAVKEAWAACEAAIRADAESGTVVQGILAWLQTFLEGYLDQLLDIFPSKAEASANERVAEVRAMLKAVVDAQK